MNGRPLAEPDADSAPFWAYAARHELRVQRCAACSTWCHPPRPTCPRCGSFERTFEQVSGRARVWSWIVAHPPLLPAFADIAPYNVAVVELEEGVRMVGHILDCASDEIAEGMDLVVAFEELSEPAEDGAVIPAWRRA